MLGVVTLLLLWGVLIEPRIVAEEEQVARVPHLPPAWEGRRVGLIADIQVGMWFANTGTARRMVRRLVEERPGAALIAGDFIYQPGDSPEEEIATAVELVRPLPEAGIPTYTVLGNHDYAMNTPDEEPAEDVARRLRAALEAAGVRVLENETVPLPAPSGPGDGEPLRLVGVGAAWPGHDKPEAALAGVPASAPRIALMHNPDSFALFPPGTAPLAMAGHTHGGQVRVPFTPEWSWMSYVEEDEVHVAGWIEGYGAPGNHLYVNRGVGFSVAPIRINCPPELTWFTLRRGAGP